MAVADKIKAILFFLLISFLLVLVQLTFSGQIILFRATTEWYIHPMLYSCLRNFGCVPVLFILSLINNRFKIKFHNFSDTPYFMLMGFFGSFANPITALYGVVNSSAGYTSLFMPLTPICATFLSILFRLDAFSFVKVWAWMKIAGILLSSIGAFIMVFNNLFEAQMSGSIVLATFYILLNVFSTTSYILIGKFMFNKSKGSSQIQQESTSRKRSNVGIGEIDNVDVSVRINKSFTDSETSNDANIEGEWDYVIKNSSADNSDEMSQSTIMTVEAIEEVSYSPLDVNLWANAYASIYFIMLFTYYVIKDRSIFKLDPRGFIPLSYSIFMASGFGLTMNLVANKAMGPAFTSGFQCLMTPFTVILGYIIFQEQLLWFDYVGGGIILLGLITISFGTFLEKR